MALIDVFQVSHNHTWFAKKMVNVYHVLRSNSGEQSADITDAFVTSILPVVRLFQSEDVINDDLVCFNLDDETDFSTHGLSSLAGTRAGLDSPTFVAPGMRFPSLNRQVRSGQKRYAGALETDYSNGILTAPAVVLIADIGAALVADWLASADSHVVGNYIIVKRVCEETDPATGECLKYRLPESDAELVFFQPTSRLVNTDITSQVSRKVF